MVTRYGMSEKLGPMIFGQKEEMVFLGREISEQRDYSEAVAQIIDEEVKKIVDEAYTRCKAILTENRDKLELVAQRLLEVETIDYEEFLQLLGEPGSAKLKRQQQSATKSAKDAREQQGNEIPPKFGAAPSPA